MKAGKTALISTGLNFGIPLLALGVGALVIKKIINKATNNTSSTAPTLKDISIDPKNLTIGETDAVLFANTLYNAMADWGTDEQAIFSTFEKIKSKDDMLLVVRKFGMKKYMGVGRAAILGQDYNLIGWLRMELDEKDMSKIKSKFISWGIPF